MIQISKSCVQTNRLKYCSSYFCDFKTYEKTLKRKKSWSVGHTRLKRAITHSSVEVLYVIIHFDGDVRDVLEHSELLLHVLGLGGLVEGPVIGVQVLFQQLYLLVRLCLLGQYLADLPFAFLHARESACMVRSLSVD